MGNFPHLFQFTIGYYFQKQPWWAGKSSNLWFMMVFNGWGCFIYIDLNHPLHSVHFWSDFRQCPFLAATCQNVGKYSIQHLGLFLSVFPGTTNILTCFVNGWKTTVSRPICWCESSSNSPGLKGWFQWSANNGNFSDMLRGCFWLNDRDLRHLRYFKMFFIWNYRKVTVPDSVATEYVSS